MKGSNIPRVAGGYRTILADPPWPYDQPLTGHARGGALKHYDTMTIDDIKALPVAALAAVDCQLWLWTTNSHLHEAFHVIEAWGFEYRGRREWVKGHASGGKLVLEIGLGYWIRGASESLLLATRGNPRSKLTGPHGATGLAISSVLLAEKGEHSAKPERSYIDIEAMSEEPRLELFARRRREGWTSWGDQLEPGKQTRLDSEPRSILKY